MLDIGCGFGDTTRRLAALVGPTGAAVGVDVAQPFVEASIAEARMAGAENVSFRAGDVQVMDLAGPFDYVFSRMGIMFFANPVAAMRNVRAAMVPGGRLVVVVWRRKLDNPWVHRAEQVVDQYLEEPEETDEPTCGPGPFSMADADTVSEQLTLAGFEQICAAALRPPDQDRQRPRSRGRVQHGARAGGRADPAGRRRGEEDPPAARDGDPRGAWRSSVRDPTASSPRRRHGSSPPRHTRGRVSVVDASTPL